VYKREERERERDTIMEEIRTKEGLRLKGYIKC
jgi:hypothetical protein